jgi:hypothetical protein
MSILQWLGPVVIALIFITLTSLLNEPARQKFMAVMIAGAGAVYISGGGVGVWEFPFCTFITYAAYRGLSSYRWTGVGWLLHTAWDVAHHQLGAPIIPFAPTSSFGCAVCDPVIAVWCFAGSPSVFDLMRGRVPRAVERAN